MRRLGLLALVALLIHPMGAAAKDPKVSAAVTQFAYATNIVHIDGADYMVLAGAERVTRADGTARTSAYAHRSRCATLEKKYFKVIACATFVFPHKVPAAAFEFDPLLDSAHLRLSDRPGRTDVRWTGRGTPSPDAGPGVDPQYGAGAYADVYRGARARGRILGLSYNPRRLGSFAIFDEGAFAEAYQMRGMRITHLDNGALKVRARYKVAL